MASSGFAALIYVLFFLSGAAALVYQVVWVRALTLVFGGSHLAVTAVLSIFMGGLAIGGYVVGKRRGPHREPASPLRTARARDRSVCPRVRGADGPLPVDLRGAGAGRDDATLYLLVVRMTVRGRRPASCRRS